MSIALVPGTMATKAIETLDLLKSRIEAGPEARSNIPSAFDKVVINTGMVADIIFFGSAAAGIYYAAIALTAYSVTPLRNLAGCGAVMLVYFLYAKFLRFPYLQEFNLIDSSKSIFRDFINKSHTSWKQDLFAIFSFENESIDLSKFLQRTALKEFLVCLTAKEGTKEDKKGIRYLKFLNMSKEEAIKAVAITKIVYTTLSVMQYFASSTPIEARMLATTLDKEKQTWEYIEKQGSTAAAAEIEEDLQLARLEPELEKRIRHIVHCLKNDLNALQIGIDPATGLIKISAMDALYNYSDIGALD